MAFEDYKYQTVSLHKAIILAIGLCFCSVSSHKDYLFLLLFYLLFFHALLMGLSIFISLAIARPKKTARRRPGEFVLSGRARFKKTGIPFLPCFAFGIILVSLLSACLPVPDVVAAFADKLFNLNALLLSVTWQPTLIGVLLSIMLGLAIIQRTVRNNYEPVSVMGEGDALVLPVFGAFLGTPLFFFSLAMGFGVALATARK
jgi:hypothetical protein